jgi:hypothetical protein
MSLFRAALFLSQKRNGLTRKDSPFQGLCGEWGLRKQHFFLQGPDKGMSQEEITILSLERTFCFLSGTEKRLLLPDQRESILPFHVGRLELILHLSHCSSGSSSV